MSSEVIVNIPSDPFQQINKKRQDIVNVDRTTSFGLAAVDPVVRVNQLEQNIRFLQEQHQIMLSGLQNEIESLRQRNRDLQFQVVFSKGGVSFISSSSPSSDEDVHGRKIILSPKEVNATPLQIELMEHDIAELRTNLSEAQTRNVYLQNVVDEQKKKLSALESEKLDLAAVGKKIGKENAKSRAAQGPATVGKESAEELQEKLEDADRLIRRLRRENEEQRKEIISLRMAVNKGGNDGRRMEGSNSHRGYYRNGQSQTSRFPPLHGNWKHSPDFQPNRHPDRVGNRMDKEPEVVGRSVPNLPHLRDRSNNAAASSTPGGAHNSNYNSYNGGSHKRGYYYHRKMDDRPGNRASRREQIFQPNNE